MLARVQAALVDVIRKTSYANVIYVFEYNSNKHNFILAKRADIPEKFR